MIQVIKGATAKATLIFVQTICNSNFFFIYLYEYSFLMFLWSVLHLVFNTDTV